MELSRKDIEKITESPELNRYLDEHVGNALNAATSVLYEMQTKMMRLEKITKSTSEDVKFLRTAIGEMLEQFNSITSLFSNE